MGYMVVIEEVPTSFGAYVPDLQGCIAVGESSEEALQLIQEAISRFPIWRFGTSKNSVEN